MVFNREEIEKFFRFLNHENYTEMRIINPWEGIKEDTFADNLADFLAVSEK